MGQQHGQQIAKVTLTQSQRPGFPERICAEGTQLEVGQGRSWRAGRTPVLPRSLHLTCKRCLGGRGAPWRALDWESGDLVSGPWELWQVTAPRRPSVSLFVNRKGMDFGSLEYDSKRCGRWDPNPGATTLEPCALRQVTSLPWASVCSSIKWEEEWQHLGLGGCWQD